MTKSKRNTSGLKRNLSPKEARENGRKGGKKSGKVRRDKKSFRELFEMVTQLKVSDQVAIDKIKEDFPGISDKDITLKLSMVHSMYRLTKGKGLTAVMAFKEVRDTMGEQPVQTSEFKGLEGTTIVIKGPDVEAMKKREKAIKNRK